MPQLPYPCSIYALVDISLREKEKRVQITLEAILADVCAALGIPENIAVSKNRRREVTLCRHIYCYVSCTKTMNSLKSIGTLIGNVDHTTVINGREVVKDLLYTKNEQFLSAWNRYLENSKLFTQYDFR